MAAPRSSLVGGMVLGVVVCLAVLGGLHLWGYRVMKHEAASPTATAERRIVCYVSPTDPGFIREQPGKDPQGRELVPVYATGEQGTAPPAKKERKIKYWVSPMDPGFVSDRPGKAPCGMDLVPVYEGEGETGAPGIIAVDPKMVQSMGVRTGKVEVRDLTHTIRAVGLVAIDEHRLAEVTTKITGWVDKLYAKAAGEPIRKGQPLLSIYSPELVSAQREYLLALKNLKTLKEAPFPELQENARGLAAASRQRLEYWDIGAAQIDALENTGEVKKHLVLTSPVHGIVTKRQVTQGQMVQAGMPLLEVADLSRVWIDADIYEYELPWVKQGQHALVTLTYLPGETLPGTVQYIYPVLKGATRTARVRLALDNPKLKLKPEMYAQVEIKAGLPQPVVAVPTEAVMDTGAKQHVFLALGQGRFAPREIKPGVYGDGGLVQVQEGLTGGEEVVTSAQFLLDSESRFREAVAQMLKTPAEKGAPAAPGPAPAPGAPAAPGAPPEPPAHPPGHRH